MPTSHGRATTYTQGVTFMHEREMAAIIAEDTLTERAPHPTIPRPATVGYMSTQELQALHGDTLQVVSLDEREIEPRIIQGRPVGRMHSARIGSGWHGKTIRLVFFQPRRSDTLSGIDTKTGEHIFAAAQQTEGASHGKIHAPDFPIRSKKQTAVETDRAHISGSHLNNLKRTTRAHWPAAETHTSSTRPKRHVVPEDDVPWDAPTNPPKNGRYVIT